MFNEAAKGLFQHRNEAHFGKTTLDETCQDCVRLMRETLQSIGVTVEDLRRAVEGGIEVPKFVAPVVKLILAQDEDAFAPPTLRTDGAATQALLQEAFIHSATAHGHDRPENGCQECTRLARALFASIGQSTELLEAAIDSGMEIPPHLVPFVEILMGTSSDNDDVWEAE